MKPESVTIGSWGIYKLYGIDWWRESHEPFGIIRDEELSAILDALLAMQADRDRWKAEAERLKRFCDEFVWLEGEEGASWADKQRATIAKLRECVEWYGDRKNWIPGPYTLYDISDGGEHARALLAEIQEET